MTTMGSIKGSSTELQKRVITGLLGAAALMSLVIFGGIFGSAILGVIIALGMIYEFASIVLTLPDKAEKRNAMLGLTWLVGFTNAFVPRSEYECLLVVFLGLFLYYLFSAERHRDEAFSLHFRELMYSIFGMIYLGFLPVFLPLIRGLPNGQHWVILFFLLVWGEDIAAFFVGKKYGHQRLYPLISPKKTIAGALGGLGAGLLVAVFYKLVFFHGLPWGSAVIISLVIGALSQVGDLCESFFKRAFSVKDSGGILPGHGGFLDRFDGIVFSLPVMYCCAKILG